MTSATFYTWEGTPKGGKPRAIGQVRENGGTAEWDSELDGPLEMFAAQDPDRADPADGKAFVASLPGIFRAAPYLWAEADPR